MMGRTNTYSLDAFKRGYLGSIHQIWAKLPQHNIKRGEEFGWRKITKDCKLFLTGKTSKCRKMLKNNRPKNMEDAKGVIGVNGGVEAIGDFQIDNKFEREMNSLAMSLQIKV